MPTRLLRHHEIDLAAWDACVDAAAQVVPYAQSWWLAATAGRWDALVELGPQGEYRAVLPLPVKRRLWGREVYQPPFTQQLGALGVVRPGELSLEWLNLRSAIGKLAESYRKLYTQLNDANGLPVRGFLYDAALTYQKRLTYHLPLHPDYAPLHAAYAADYRRRLQRNAQAAAPLRITETLDAEPLLALFQQTKGPAAGLRRRHYALLRQLVAEAQRRGQAELREVRVPATGELLAGALLVRYRTRLVYLFAAASEAGKKASAPLLLLDAAIRRHAGTPGLVLDFEGGMIPSIARFFANFGAVPVPYAALSFHTSPRFLQWLR